MSSTTGPSATTLTNKIDSYNSNGAIDNVSNLKNHRVYIYTGKKDTVVNPGNIRLFCLYCVRKLLFMLVTKGVVKLNEQVYSKYLSSSNIKTVYTYDSVHGMVKFSFYIIFIYRKLQ